MCGSIVSICAVVRDGVDLISFPAVPDPPAPLAALSGLKTVCYPGTGAGTQATASFEVSRSRLARIDEILRWCQNVFLQALPELLGVPVFELRECAPNFEVRYIPNKADV
eukprot:1468068-Rhodomonas_salina.1